MSKRFWSKCKRSICCGAPVIDGPEGPICSKEGCYKPVERSVDVAKTMPAPVPSFIEPKEIERDEPLNGGYSVGEDSECMPGYIAPESGQSEPLAGMPERYRDPKNKGLL